jgi:hypothetical protein
MITVMLAALFVQSAAINSQRDGFIACLDRAAAEAKAQKIMPEAIEPHLRSTCAASQASFEGSLIAFDVKNKVGRKQAAADAKLQIDDFVSSSVERYKKQRAGERG